MSATETDELARVRLQHQTWRIEPVRGPDWRGYVATRQEQLLTADTLPQLELKLAGR